MSDKTVRDLHNDAMQHAMAAHIIRDQAHHTGDEFDAMIAEFQIAWELENRAVALLVDAVPDPGKRQPTERILRRSAVSCLYSAFEEIRKMEGEEQ